MTRVYEIKLCNVFKAHQPGEYYACGDLLINGVMLAFIELFTIHQA